MKKVKTVTAATRLLQETATCDALAIAVCTIEKYKFIPGAVAKLEKAGLHLNMQFPILDYVAEKLTGPAKNKLLE